MGQREQAGVYAGTGPVVKERGEAGFGRARAEGGRVHWLLHPAVSIVLPAAKLPANAGMVRVPSRAARPLPHPSLGQLAIRLQTQRVGWRAAAAARR